MINKTIEYYNTNATKYFESTISVNLTHLYNLFLESLPKGNTILDLGCGSGRDSLYFKSKGYKVTALDGSPQLAAKATELLDQEVIVMNFEDFNLQEKFDRDGISEDEFNLIKNKIQTLIERGEVKCLSLTI